MGKTLTTLLCGCLACAAAFVISGQSAEAATFADFEDTAGHWAAETLEQACVRGILQGFEDLTVRPDDPINEAEIITILTRVLHAEQSVDPSRLGLHGTEWYAEAAGKAAYLGLIGKYNQLSQAELPRLNAFLLLADAFQLTQASPDYQVLDAFSDLDEVPLSARNALAALVSQGYVQGYEGKLSSLKPISRAEFVTILSRIAPSAHSTADYDRLPTGNLILSGEATLNGVDFSSNDIVWLDCSTTDPTLHNVTAKQMIFRSQHSNAPELSGTTTIASLTLSGGDGTELTFSPSGKTSVDTLVIGDHQGKLKIGGNVRVLEVTGDHLDITISTNLDRLVLSGTDCKITTGEHVTVKEVSTEPYSRNHRITLAKDAAALSLNGSGHAVSADGKVQLLRLLGQNIAVTGEGTIAQLEQYTRQSTVSLPAEQTTDRIDYGIEGLSVTLEGPDLLPIGETLTVTARLAPLNTGRPADCTATWLINGQVVKEGSLTARTTDSTQEHIAKTFDYSRDMDTQCVVELRLDYTTYDGLAQRVTGTKTVTLENHPTQYYDQYNPEAVLKRVTTGYQGDYTLEWAEANDYDEKTKELWVNTKGYSSKTQYLIWINTTYQRVNIFTGSSGNWALLRSHIVGTGRDGHNTPVGVYTVGTRTRSGWTTSTYNVRPVVRFKMGSGLAFHSRKYDPKYTKMIDPSIGYPISLGCIRMYDEDIWWIYDNIPELTTVVVY